MRIAALLTIVLLIGLGIWIARNTEWAEIALPSPPRGEARTNPFYAAEHFSRSLGATAATDPTFVEPPPGSLLVLSGLRWGLIAARQHALEQWVEQGGRLIVDASVLDDVAFRTWSGIVQKRVQTPRPTRNTLNDDDPVTLDLGCRVLERWPRDPAAPVAAPLQLCGFQNGSYLESVAAVRWELRDQRGAQVLRVPAGRGSVTAVNATPFTGTGLLEFSHAALFVAVTQIRPTDTVHFLTEVDYPSLFALVWLRGWPVVVLVLAFTGAWIWRKSARFGPMAPPDQIPRRSLEEQIRGTGEFARRHGGLDALLDAAGRALDDVARRRISGYARMTNEQRAESLAVATGLTPHALLSALTGGDRRAMREVDALHTIETARRQLLAAHPRT
ncbi:MAG TPA: DUF4350 domain-containing protein [Gemmatimonadaceae bacterium]